jgi:hypothetical protein
VIFTIPDILVTSKGPRQRPDTWHSGPLAFVEWYSSTPSSAEENHGCMYRIKKIKTPQGRVRGAIIPLSNIRQSCMLSPAFEKQIPKTWRSDNILDLASTFFINNWSSKHAYQTIW